MPSTNPNDKNPCSADPLKPNAWLPIDKNKTLNHAKILLFISFLMLN